VGYVPLAEVGAEFLFQVVAERAEGAAVVLTTNLPFAEWTQVIPKARLCKALLDRITDRAHNPGDRHGMNRMNADKDQAF
jgi:DNA replication protein DnaC